MKPGNPPLQSVRVLDQLRERIRYMHYSLSTEQVYVYWVRFFIRWSARDGGMRHPREMGAADVEAFLTMLATQRKVSASTHNQALSAILFLYRVVMLPRSLEPALRLQMLAARAQWEADCQAQRGGVWPPVPRLDIRGDGSGRFRRPRCRTVQELLGHSDVSTTMIYTHVLKVAAGGTASPLVLLCHKVCYNVDVVNSGRRHDGHSDEVQPLHRSFV